MEDKVITLRGHDNHDYLFPLYEDNQIGFTKEWQIPILHKDDTPSNQETWLIENKKIEENFSEMLHLSNKNDFLIVCNNFYLRKAINQEIVEN